MIRLRPGRSLVIVFIVEPQSWEARRFEWWSPFHQQVMCPKQAERSLHNARCRAICTTEAMPLLKACAQNAFGSLGKVALLRLAKHYEVGVEKSDSLFPIAFVLVQWTTGFDERQVLDALRSRFEVEDSQGVVVEALQQECFSDILDRDEKEEVNAQVEKVRKAKSVQKSFKIEWLQKDKVAKEKAVAKKVGKQRRGTSSSSAASGTWRGPSTFPRDLPETYEVKHL